MSASFGGAQEEGPIAGLDGVRERYGEDSDEYKDYVRLLKATGSIIDIAEFYYLSPEGSPAEMQAAKALSRMIENLRDNPLKAGSLVESLTALIVHMKHGGTYEEWFEGVDRERTATATA